MENSYSNPLQEKADRLKLNLETFGIAVERVNHVLLSENNIDVPINPGVISLVLLNEGEGIISINDTDYNIVDNSLIILLPNYNVKRKITHEIAPEGYIVAISIDAITNISIKTEFMIPMFMMFQSLPIINLSDKERNSLFKYFELLYNEEKAENSEIKFLICSSIVQSLTYKISEILRPRFIGEYEKHRSKSSIRIFKEFIKLATTEFRKHRDVAYYANKLCVTPKYLSTIVKDISKNKASRWIEILVVSEAKNLLHYSDMTIQEIAYNLNFPNPSFFGAYFKKYTGMTPGEYRKR